jgi:hypothetical protein
MRNEWLQEYTGLILAALAEAMQHTENRQPTEISTTFGFDISQLLQRVYVRMATELLQIDPAVANDPKFVITQAMLNAYNPAAWFTPTEMIDVTAPSIDVPTGADKQVLTDGIPARLIVNLALWPDGTPYNPMAGSTVDILGNSAGGSSLPGLDSTGGSTAGAGTTPAPGGGSTTMPSAATSANVPPFTANPATTAPANS